MSFLYPLLLAGIGAVVLPILAHMIRHRTRKQVPFSSLMFVPVTLPRFTSRSRVENWPLLILRCLVICLIAAAFARPFFAKPVEERPTDGAKRVVVLLDTSASMRRAGLWEQAVAEVRKIVRNAGPADRVCVMSFDREPRTLVGFDAWSRMDMGVRGTTVMDRVEELKPGWGGTDLGRAMVAAGEAVEEDDIIGGAAAVGGIHGQDARATTVRGQDARDTAVVTTGEIVLVCDLQQGSDLDALGAYEWPGEVGVKVKTVRCAEVTNASAQWISGVGQSEDELGDSSAVIRVSNASDSTAEQFRLSWMQGGNEPGDANDVKDVYVAPGYHAVVHMGGGGDPTLGGKVVLSGDAHDFDNTLYIAPYLKRQVRILYVGHDDPNDPVEMLFYVRRAFLGGGVFRPVVEWRRPDEKLTEAELGEVDMVVAAGAMSSQNTDLLRGYLKSGRTVLWIAGSEGDGQTLERLTGVGGVDMQEAKVNRYAMLGRLDFDHPILIPFADPKFGDFSRIHFWKYRKIDANALPEARVLGSFDSGDPAWLEVPVGEGSLLVWTCGWGRVDSDLALSSKFVPLLYCCLEHGGASVGRRRQYFVGDVVTLPRRFGGSGNGGVNPALRGEVKVKRPDGSEVVLGEDEKVFTQTDLPGVYSVESGGQVSLFAVNVPAGESRTSVMELEELEKMGVGFEADKVEPTPEMKARQQQASLAVMERQQKLWRWLLVAALGLLLIEIVWAGWLTGRPEDLKETNDD